MARIQGEKASALLRAEARLIEMRLLGMSITEPSHQAAAYYLRELIQAFEAGADALRDRDYNALNFRRSKGELP